MDGTPPVRRRSVSLWKNIVMNSGSIKFNEPSNAVVCCLDPAPVSTFRRSWPIRPTETRRILRPPPATRVFQCPYADQWCSGSVQSIFSSPSRRTGFVVPRISASPRRRPKNALHYAASGISGSVPTPDEQPSYVCGSAAGVSSKPSFAACVRSLNSALMFAC